MKTLPITAIGSRSADYNRTAYHIEVDPTVSLEDLLRPGFWAHHAGSLKRGDLIDVLSVDGAYDVTLRVVGTAIGMVEMRALRIWLRDEPAAAEEADIDAPAGYKVNYAPKHKWRVLMDGFADPISKDHASRADATRAAIAHAAKANAVAA